MAQEPSMFPVIEKMNAEFDELHDKYIAEQKKRVEAEKQLRYFQILSEVNDHLKIKMSGDAEDPGKVQQFLFDIKNPYYEFSEVVQNAGGDEFIGPIMDCCVEWLTKKAEKYPDDIQLYRQVVLKEIFCMKKNTEPVDTSDLPYKNEDGDAWYVVSENYIRELYVSKYEENLQYDVDLEFDFIGPSKEDPFSDIVEWLETNNDDLFIPFPLPDGKDLYIYVAFDPIDFHRPV